MIVKLALYAEQKKPGAISEIWSDKVVVDELKSNIPTPDEVSSFIEILRKSIDELTDKRRKSYLKEIVHSLEVQIKNNTDKFSYSDFCEENFGYRIERVTEEDIESIEQEIVKIEKEMDITRFEIFKKHEVSKSQYKAQFAQYIEKVKRKLPDYLLDFQIKDLLLKPQRENLGVPLIFIRLHTNQ